ncbi:unnamed protein product [Lasius platythorax]|uniref:Uncharacterized protein n=1 Tax=Lasius platythorax TaxID=488582 RepID=A0AAV2NBH4_9HYME
MYALCSRTRKCATCAVGHENARPVQFDTRMRGLCSWTRECAACAVGHENARPVQLDTKMRGLCSGRDNVHAVH